MSLKFTITDYTTNPTGDSAVVNEPVGWDSTTLRLKRDVKWHGFFDFLDDSYNSMQWHGTARDILSAAYQAKGVEAACDLLVQYACSDTDTFMDLYTGRFVFSGYKFICADMCYVECGIEHASCLMAFKNRFNQKVDLDSLSTFDNPAIEQTTTVTAQFIAGQTIKLTGSFPWLHSGIQITIDDTVLNNGTFTVMQVTATPTGYTTIKVASIINNEAAISCTLTGTYPVNNLQPYYGLDKEYVLPSKKVYLESFSVVDKDTSFHALQNTDGTTGWAINPGIGYHGGFRQCWHTIDTFVLQGDLSTLNNTVAGYGEFVSGSEPDTPWPAEVFALDLLPVCSSFDIKIKVSFTGTFYSPGYVEREEELKFRITKGAPFTFSPGYIDVITRDIASTGAGVPVLFPMACNIETTVTMAPGEKLYFWFYYRSVKTNEHQSDAIVNINNDFKIILSSDSLCNNTNVSAYMVNEALSRTTEIITNDCLRVYSDYYGRIGAKPYGSTQNGCGSLRAITNGLKIRNAIPQDGYSALKLKVSMQDLFDALNATDNIGMCLKQDPHRTGHHLVRVEPVQYFYEDTVLMECNAVADVKATVSQQQLITVFKTGYQKWKTWNVNGLNDIFGARQYRTSLTTLSSELDKTCKFIASDYAIEWMRRQYGLSSSDSRYDEDVFFICLKQQHHGMVPPEYFEFVAPNKLIIRNYSFDDTFFAGDSITVTGAAQAGTFDVTAVTVTGNHTELTLSGTVYAETGGGLVLNNTHPHMVVEQGVQNSANINFPETVLNYRLAPSRNAMRWFKTVLQSYRQYADGKLYFTDGDGNTLGQGMVNDPAGCRLETAIIQEQADIKLADFATPAEHHPLMYPELVTFEYPVTWQQYLTIKDNPYGLIGYQCGSGPMQYGWIEDFQLKPYTGMGQFTLRPKIES